MHAAGLRKQYAEMSNAASRSQGDEAMDSDSDGDEDLPLVTSTIPQHPPSASSSSLSSTIPGGHHSSMMVSVDHVWRTW